LKMSGSYLFAALLVLLLAFVTAEASEDLSGRWKISYAVESSSAGDLSEGSVAYLSEKDGTLQGRMTLGSRGDGYLIGYCMDSSFRAAITFRHNPAMFVRLTGCSKGGELHGRFTASSCEGGFWKGDFRAIQLVTGAGEVINTDTGANPVIIILPDEDIIPKPTLFLDPEANWSAQQETGVGKIFAISYQRDTILMVRNKPLLWQWWL
jgi:hypothetical protein